MNDEDAKALGMLWKAIPGASWQPRMMNGNLNSYVYDTWREGDGFAVRWQCGDDIPSDWEDIHDEDWPDFRDPPTMGWLLHQVREAWQEPSLSTWRHIGPRSGWSMHSPDCRGADALDAADTEAEVLVAALGKAPRE